MSVVANALAVVNPNEVGGQIPKERSQIPAVPRSVVGGSGNNPKQNASKQSAKFLQSAYTTQSSNLSSVSTLSGAIYTTSYNPAATTPYSLPSSSQPRIFIRTSSTPAPITRTGMVKSTVGFDRNRNVRAQVERAMREHKIYSCIGVYPAVRKALQKRGWIEKNPSLGIARSTNLGNATKELESRGFDDESDQAWMNRVLRDYPPDFIWVIRRDNIDWRSLHKDQLINRFPKAFFTTKVGIAACLQNMQWFSEAGVSDTFFPRCYRLCIDEEKTSFIDDYRLSACMGLLKWVVSAYEKDGETGVMDPSSRVVSLAVDFAVRQVNNYVRMRRHEDIDWLMPPAFMGQHWDVFLNQYYNVVLMKCKLAPNDSQDTGKLKYDAAKRALQRISPFWPQLNTDGTNNIWICKPGARSRGKGIIILNQLDKILDLLSQNNYREANWVVQKYIERPLLIYKTKFDIRQWFVVSDWSPLTVWFYKESYIRFCTKPFSLDDFHESIHLCNNAVQCRYQNSELRDTALPDENMWDCYTFQSYLKSIGKLDTWENLIYPGMKQGILGVMLASQETVDVHKNCFELYGADFMLSEDMRPWLIEINSCPCMAPSTSVTARMCAQCLEDCVKIVIDRREDRSADTGLFELIFKQTQSSIPLPFNSVDLIVQGKKLTRDVDWPSIMTKYNSKRIPTGTSSTRMLRASQQPSSVSNGLTFMDLVQRLRLKEAQMCPPVANSTPNTAPVSPNPKSGLSPKSASKIPTDGSKLSNSSIVSVRKMTVPEPGNNNSLSIVPVQSNNNNSDNPDNKEATKNSGNEKLKPAIVGKAGSKTNSNRRVKIVNNTEQPSTMRQSNTETLLSALLKSSVNNQPTMADLVRLSQEADQETNQRTKLNTFGHTNPEPFPEPAEPRKGRTLPQNHSKSKTPSITSTEGSHTGKIRPNSRTLNIQPLQSKRGSDSQSVHSAHRSKSKESSGSLTKYG
ncbi:unnamed protein product [Allacma fusca]|uniref:Tubulin glycylase 3A n=1 Tax=Allacma fusca TaxID=39272 RepID=A0A8J2JA12_9HEXA|nr:unnamed protein product [Allacma fusca]